MTPLGFAPDSVYAEWTAGQRAVAERMEADFNHQRARQLALADLNRGADHACAGGEKGQTGPLWISGSTVRGTPDAGLRRLAKVYRRELEDVACGDLPGGEKRARLVKIKLRDIEREQDWRVALAETWQASEAGTHSYTDFQARGGLLAVLEDGARPPSYDLAELLDWEHWKRGLEHVLGWDEREARRQREQMAEAA